MKTSSGKCFDVGMLGEMFMLGEQFWCWDVWGKFWFWGGNFDVGMLGGFSLSNPVCLLCYNLVQDYDYLTLCESEQQHYLGWNTKETLCRFSSIGFDSKIMYITKCLFPPRVKLNSHLFSLLWVSMIMLTIFPWKCLNFITFFLTLYLSFFQHQETRKLQHRFCDKIL